MTDQIKHIYSKLFNLKGLYIATLDSYASNLRQIDQIEMDKDDTTKDLMILNMKSRQLLTRFKTRIFPKWRQQMDVERRSLESFLEGFDLKLEDLTKSNLQLITTLHETIREITDVKNAVIGKSEKVREYVNLCMDHWYKSTDVDFIIDPLMEKREYAAVNQNDALLAECDYILTYMNKIIKRATVVPNKLFEKLSEQDEVLPTIVQNTKGIKVVNQ